jgi:hypothetical protein
VIAAVAKNKLLSIADFPLDPCEKNAQQIFETMVYLSGMHILLTLILFYSENFDTFSSFGTLMQGLSVVSAFGYMGIIMRVFGIYAKINNRFST